MSLNTVMDFLEAYEISTWEIPNPIRFFSFPTNQNTWMLPVYMGLHGLISFQLPFSSIPSTGDLGMQVSITKLTRQKTISSATARLTAGKLRWVSGFDS